MQNTYRWGWETCSAHRLRAAAAAAADRAAVSGRRARGRGRVGSQSGGGGRRMQAGVFGLGQTGVGHGERLLAVQRHHHHICDRALASSF